MHELTIRISRAFCRGVFPQLNGELEADTALASNSATSGAGQRGGQRSGQRGGQRSRGLTSNCIYNIVTVETR
ncbi:MAG: hypothetical protein FWF88_05190 [Peptococcaceae bacterium]|nr:hypothetical protein [Peptococcaceae bacterium]